MNALIWRLHQRQVYFAVGALGVLAVLLLITGVVMAVVSHPGMAGSEPLDRGALREVILRFALLIRAVPEVVEADLNPVRCMPSGCVVLDTRLRIERRLPVERVKTW